MAKFSKQHYQAIADILVVAKSYAGMSNPAHDAIGFITNELADVFQKDNERFNREHFLAVVRGERPVNSRPPRS